MRMCETTKLMLAAAFVGGMAFLPANEASAQTERHHARPRVQMMREQFDVNKDGVVDEAERTAARETIRQKALAKFDANRDGDIDEDERPLLHRPRQPRFDADPRAPLKGPGELRRPVAEHFDGPRHEGGRHFEDGHQFKGRLHSEGRHGFAR